MPSLNARARRSVDSAVTLNGTAHGVLPLSGSVPSIVHRMTASGVEHVIVTDWIALSYVPAGKSKTGVSTVVADTATTITSFTKMSRSNSSDDSGSELILTHM